MGLLTFAVAALLILSIRTRDAIEARRYRADFIDRWGQKYPDLAPAAPSLVPYLVAMVGLLVVMALGLVTAL